MSKKSNKTGQTSSQEVETKNSDATADVVVESKPQSVKELKDSKVKSTKKKEKKPNLIVRKIKETGSELKKVSWPSFPTVVKKTGVVIAVVLIFLVIVFGIDRLLSILFDLLTSSLS